MLINDNKKEKKETPLYEPFSAEKSDYLFKVDETPAKANASSNEQPSMSVGNVGIKANVSQNNLLGDEWEASKKRIEGFERRWGNMHDATDGSKLFRQSFTSYMMPKDTPERRRKVYSLSQEALDDVVEEYYNAELKDNFMRNKAEAKAKGRKVFENNPHLVATFPMQLFADAAKEDNPTDVINKSMASVNDERLRELVSPLASTGGYNVDDYINSYVKPSLQNRMVDEYVKESVPKSRGEYIIRSATENSLIGKLSQLSVNGNKNASDIMAIEHEGLSKFNSNRTDNFLSGVGSLMIDAPVFQILGMKSTLLTSALGRKATPFLVKNLAKKVMTLPGRSNITKEVATRFAEKTIKDRLKYKISQGALTQGLTLGDYDLANSVVNDLFVGEGINVGEAAKSFGKGAALGSASSLAAAPFRIMSKGAGGAKKLLFSTSALGSESAVFTAGHEIEKLANGVDVEPIDLLYDYGESAATLLTMRLANWMPKGKEPKFDKNGNIKKYSLGPDEMKEIKQAGFDAEKLFNEIEKHYSIPRLNKSESTEWMLKTYDQIKDSKEISESTKEKLKYFFVNKATALSIPYDYSFKKAPDGRYKVTIYDYYGQKIERALLNAENASIRIKLAGRRIIKNRIIMHDMELTYGMRSHSFITNANNYIKENNIKIDDFVDAAYNKSLGHEVSPEQQKMIDDVVSLSSYDTNTMKKYLYQIRRSIEQKYGLDNNSLCYLINSEERLTENEKSSINEYEAILRNEVDLLKSGITESHAKDIQEISSQVAEDANNISMAKEYAEYSDVVAKKNNLGNAKAVDMKPRLIDVSQKPSKGVVWNYYNNEFSQSKLDEYVSFANNLSKRLHTPIELITDERQIKIPDENNLREVFEYNNQVMAYGWTYKDKIYINIPNCKDLETLEKTIVHESVGHNGLEKVFGYQLRDFLEEMYKKCDEDIRNEIDKYIDWNRNVETYTAVEEYIAHKIEDVWMTQKERSFIQRFKDFIKDMFRRMGIYATESKRNISKAEIDELLALHCRYVLKNANPKEHREQVFGRYDTSHVPEILYKDYEAYDNDVRKRISEKKFFDGTPEKFQDYKTFLNYDRLSEVEKQIFRKRTGMSDEYIMNELKMRKYSMPSGDNSHTGEKSISGERSGAIPGNYVDYSGKALKFDYPYYDNGEVRYRLPADVEYENEFENFSESDDGYHTDASPVVRNSTLGELLNEPALFALHPYLGDIDVEVLKGSSFPASYNADDNTIVVGDANLYGDNVTELFAPAIRKAVENYTEYDVAVSRNSHNIREDIKKEYNAIQRDIEFLREMNSRSWRSENSTRFSEAFKKKYGLSAEEFNEIFPSVDEYMLYRLSGRKLPSNSSTSNATPELSSLKQNFNGPLDILAYYNGMQGSEGVNLSRVAERVDNARLTPKEKADFEDELEAYAMHMLNRMKPRDAVRHSYASGIGAEREYA